jgi:hypothetical protein
MKTREGCLVKEIVANVFLSHKKINKLTLLDYIHNHTKASVPELASVLSVSDRSIKTLIQELQHDILVKVQQNPLHFKNSFYFLDKFTLEDYYHLRKQLELEYYTSSPLLQFFQELIEHRKMSIYDLAERISYSESHTYRLSRKLNDFFAASIFDLAIDEKDYTLELIGEEIEIRLLNYYFYLHIFGDLQWPFQSIPHDYSVVVAKEKDKFLIGNNSNANWTRFEIFITIWKNSMLNNNFIGAVSSDLLRLDEEFKQLIDFSELELFNLNRLSSHSANEKAFFHVLLIYLFPELVSEADKVTLGKKFFEECHDVQMVQHASFLCKKVLQDYNLSQQNFFSLLYETTVLGLLFQDAGLWKFDSLLTHYEASSDFHYPQISDWIAASFGDVFSDTVLFEFCYYLYQIITSYNLHQQAKQLMIYTGFFLYPEMKQIVDRTLTMFYAKHLITFTNNIQDAEIIISDIPHTQIDTPHFLITDIKDLAVWKLLGKF